jgi:hypothetical protein
MQFAPTSYHFIRLRSNNYIYLYTDLSVGPEVTSKGGGGCRTGFKEPPLHATVDRHEVFFLLTIPISKVGALCRCGA